MEETIEKLTHLEHILKRPDSYIGSTARSGEPYWVLQPDGSKFVQDVMVYPPGLIKIFDEILVNATDRNQLYPTQVTKVKVLVDQASGLISVENNGPLGGIQVAKHPTEKNIWNPELTFGNLLTSTNYNDNEKRIVGGRNGYGAKLTNIFSTKFMVTINDSVNKLKYSQKWENNMIVCHPPKMSSYTGNESSVTISFVPDWERFGGMTGMNTAVYKILEKRVWDASICTSNQCSVYFQTRKIKTIGTEAYARMYLDDDIKTWCHNTDRWSVVVAPSESGNFEHVSFVNGIATTKGGEHVKYVSGMISEGIVKDLEKKIKLKPQQVKNTLFVFVRCVLENPEFSSQIKSECTLKVQEFGSWFDPPKTFVKSILKTGVHDEVLELSKFKEQKELKKTDGSARKNKITGIPKLDDAHKAGTALESGKCTLIVTEGDSAKTLAVAGLSVVGRDHYGVYPIRGKFKNVRDASVKQLMENKEFNELKKILGLQQEKEYTSLDELRYGRLMVMTDADNDGSHIKGLLLNMIETFWPSLIDLGFVVSLVTPIIRATKGAAVESFYTDAAYRQWYDVDGGRPGWKIKYYKGLGTSTSAEAREYFKNLTQLTVQFEDDNQRHRSILLAFDKKKADARKTWLLENSEINRRRTNFVNYGKVQNLTVTDFIHKDLVHFSLADLERSVASMADGFKPSQRKVIFACFQRNLKKEIKVAQLAAYVSEKTSYHHGEVSLADTIVNMAQDYTGSNNMNLLVPKGQFGTRLQGGKDSSQIRYIFTHLADHTRKLFDSADDAVLTYLDDDGVSIEPEFFVPTLPNVLINGTQGIGTGFSSYVPPYNPKDIKSNITRILNGKAPVPMTPWFRGFTGIISESPDTEGTYVMEGKWKTRGSTVTITELPPGRWTNDFKEHLETLVQKKVIADYKNNSTTTDVNFEISRYSGNEESLIRDFKLQKVIHTTNMHLFHPTKGITKYKTPEDILVDFVEIRMQYYLKRKDHLVKTLTEKALRLKNKSRFVKMVVDEELVVFRKKKAVLEAELVTLNFDQLGGDFGYLLGIRTSQYTEEEIESLDTDTVNIETDLETLKKTSLLSMWKTDILKI
jgi:DNA topoisomerase II